MYATHLYDVFSVLSSVLENTAAVLQVFFIQTECLGVHLLERWIPKLRLLQVNQEVGVDWTTLNQSHTTDKTVYLLDYPEWHSLFFTDQDTFENNLLDIEVLQKDSQTLTRSLDRKFAGAVDLIKRQTFESIKIDCCGKSTHKVSQ